MKYTEEQLNKRVECAITHFNNGFNCAQAVVLAFADIYELQEDVAARVAASFGGGIGRMRETCGAACGLFILAGLDTSSISPSDKESKNANYKLVQSLAQKFKEENGSLCCGELLGLKPRIDSSEDSVHTEKSKSPKRPCFMMVESAARIWANYLLHKE